MEAAHASAPLAGRRPAPGYRLNFGIMLTNREAFADARTRIECARGGTLGEVLAVEFVPLTYQHK